MPLIFLTAFSQSDYVNWVKAVNPSAYLVKPFNNDNSFNEEEIIIGPYQIPIGRNYKDDFLKSFRYL